MTGTLTCTWIDCKEVATEPQIARDGECWANLCQEHAKLLLDTIRDSQIPKLVAYWVMAGGGPKKMASRVASKEDLMRVKG